MEKVIKINIEDDIIKINKVDFHKMIFIFNAIQDGWCVKKINDTYTFKKKHENKEEIFLDNYLSTFMSNHSSYKNLLS